MKKHSVEWVKKNEDLRHFILWRPAKREERQKKCKTPATIRERRRN